MIFAYGVSSVQELIPLCCAVVESVGSLIAGSVGVGGAVDGCCNHTPRRARQVDQCFPYGNQD